MHYKRNCCVSVKKNSKAQQCLREAPIGEYIGLTSNSYVHYDIAHKNSQCLKK